MSGAARSKDGVLIATSTESMAASASRPVHPQITRITSRTTSPTQTRCRPPNTRRSSGSTNDENFTVPDSVSTSLQFGVDQHVGLTEHEPEGAENNRAVELLAMGQSSDAQGEPGDQLMAAPVEDDPASAFTEAMNDSAVQMLVQSKAAFAHVLIYCFAFLLVILWQAEQSELYETSQIKPRKSYLIAAVFISALVSQTHVPSALAALTLIAILFVVAVASVDAFDYFGGGLAYVPIAISVFCICAALYAIVKHRMHTAQQPSESSKVNTASVTFLLKAIIKWSPFTTPEPTNEEVFKIGEALLYGSFIAGLFILWLRAIGLRSKGGPMISNAVKQCGPSASELLESVIKLLVGVPRADQQYRGTFVLTFLEVLGFLYMVSGVVVWIFAFNLPHPVQAGSMTVLISCIAGVIVITCAPLPAERRRSLPIA